ncbi:MAG TPA: CoA transferase [Pirellulales bacterium]|jgi:crotonobetainyl-CoA:carnitine CoA-transferase CaiB-like acyl-CoA transferase|nr:CoA transferase [Pirellulales bacterium]
MSDTLPLAGLRVLDLSRILAGPFCCQILGDLGADVVKVERPLRGDDTRQWGPPFLGEPALLQSAYFLAANRNKRSLALDLATDAGQQILIDLIRRADVLVENFLPDSAQRLGLSPARLQELNPDLVSCSISGFGRTGPLANTPGYDLAIQAALGLMSITGEADGSPLKVGVAITDIIAGLYAATSVLAGLWARGRGVPGRAFDLALADCTLASLVNVAQSALLTGLPPVRFGNAHPNIVPYEAYATADGHLVLAIGNDRQWARFCAACGQSAWATDARFATNPARVEQRTSLNAQLSALLATRSTKTWQILLTEHAIPHAAVAPVDEVLAAPQTAARGMVQTVRDSSGREYQILGSPIHWDGESPRGSVAEGNSAPPQLGEQGRTVLQEWLQCTPQQIADWKAAGVVG